MKFEDKIRRVGFAKTIDDLFGNRFSYLHYLWCKLTNRVYFGSYLAATQGKKVRHYYMQGVIKEYCKRFEGNMKILEVGSWAGGSAITWADAIKSYSRQRGMVLCIDPWIDYIDTAKDSLWTHKMMKRAFKKAKIYSLFLHNIIASNNSDIVSVIRCSGAEIATMLKDHQFDLIFIDANHYYQFVSSDIKDFAPLIKEAGILCGDDLKLQFHEVDKEFLYNMKDRDVIIDTVKNQQYHPGVTRAVYEYLNGDVSVWEGFGQ